MDESAERALNQAAYRQLRDSIREQYPHGRFVGIAGGKIVADAANFDELDSLLDEMGFTSPEAMVVEAGVNYPDRATILLEGGDDGAIARRIAESGSIR